MNNVLFFFQGKKKSFLTETTRDCELIFLARGRLEDNTELISLHLQS